MKILKSRKAEHNYNNIVIKTNVDIYKLGDSPNLRGLPESSDEEPRAGWQKIDTVEAKIEYEVLIEDNEVTDIIFKKTKSGLENYSKLDRQQIETDFDMMYDLFTLYIDEIENN